MSNGDQEKPNRLWSPEEDEMLREYVKKHGERKWNDVKKLTGLNRAGKSCRQRWLHHLKPGLKKDDSFTSEEEQLIVKLHAELGNQWAKIAQQLPGRTNYDIRNFWRLRADRLQCDGLPIHPPQVSQQIQIGSQDAAGDDALDPNGDYVLDLSDVVENDCLDPVGDETEEAKKKKSGKSSVLLDVKPWDNETDMNKLEEAVRSVEMTGLLWEKSILFPDGSGIKKLQIMSTIIDDLVSVDSLIEEHLTAEPCNEFVRSCDIVAICKE